MSLGLWGGLWPWLRRNALGRRLGARGGLLGFLRLGVFAFAAPGVFTPDWGGCRGAFRLRNLRYGGAKCLGRGPRGTLGRWQRRPLERSFFARDFPECFIRRHWLPLARQRSIGWRRRNSGLLLPLTHRAWIAGIGHCDLVVVVRIAGLGRSLQDVRLGRLRGLGDVGLSQPGLHRIDGRLRLLEGRRLGRCRVQDGRRGRLICHGRARARGVGSGFTVCWPWASPADCVPWAGSVSWEPSAGRNYGPSAGWPPGKDGRSQV